MQLNPVPISESGTAHEALFTVHGWLSQQPAGFRRQILEMARSVSVARGEWVFSINDPPGGIYGVVSGGIGIEGGGPFHMLRLGHVLRAGSWFGHHPILVPGARRTQGMRAMEDSALLYVPLAPLEALVKVDPVAARCIGSMADGGSILAIRIISDLLIPDAGQRIAAVLLRVTAAEDGIEPHHPDGFLMTQAELGEMANVSRPHVNQTLGELERKGWIIKHYQRLRIVDVEGLRSFAASGS
jgi:CRP/FNR family transcriptional regulator, cyclic AMP receptor protein